MLGREISALAAAVLVACVQGAPRPGAPAERPGPPSEPAPAARAEADGLLAFPGAVGWAARTPGGRGGRIVRVTTLAARGPGSLSEALAGPGPRVVVFEVGGVIDLARETLDVTEPFLTIAGQTAPPPGIALIRGGLRVLTHDVVIQHLRVRPGEAGQAKRSGWEVDGIATGSGARDVIVDHCSISWATDENLSASGARFDGATPEQWRKATSHRITFTNNIVAEGLSESTHGKGEHSKGTLIHDNVSDVVVAFSLYHSNVERNPFFKGGARGIVVNNLITNPARYAVKYTLVEREWGERPHQRGQLALVGNVLVHGPETPPGTPLLYASGVGPCDVFLSDNALLSARGDPPLLGGAIDKLLPATRPPLWPDGFEALPSSAVIDHVRHNAGARPWDRDATDRRIVAEALSGRGKVVDSESEVEGYPTAQETRRPFDEARWDLTYMVRR